MPSSSEALAAAIEHHRAGRFAEAERIYRHILRDHPDHAAALHLLGLIAHEAGRHDVAIEHIRRAIALLPGAPPYHLNLALAYQSAGQPEQAAASLRAALHLRPDYAEAHNNLGAVLRTQGRLDEAAAHLRQALATLPEFAEAHSNLGQVLHQQGHIDLALASYRRALELKPNLPEVHYNLARAHEALDEPAEQIASLRRALELRPQYADAHRQLGAALVKQDRPHEALPHLRACLRLQPGHPEARVRLEHVLRALGKTDEADALSRAPPAAEVPAAAVAARQRADALLRAGHVGAAVAAYRQAVALWPAYAHAHNDLGNALQQAGRLDEATAAYGRALEIEPGLAAAHGNLGVLCKDQGRLDLAAEHFRAALLVHPTGTLRVLLATLLPPVYSSIEDVELWRSRLTENLASLRRRGLGLDPAREIVPNLFYLAYQGGNDRDLQRDLAALYTAGMTNDLPPPRPHAPGGKIHMGLISKYLKNHTIGMLMRGLVARLSRQAFTVTVLTFPHPRDPVVDFIHNHADRVVMLSEDVAAARRTIADLGLDVLFYADIGMDPFTYTLAFSRLAPVQCVTWGHPLTTGIPTIDYFLSSDLVEPEGAEAHYTERLVRLRTLPFFYYRPSAPPPKDRSHFGLPADAHIYACLQTLFKFHPTFDDVLAGILRRDPRGLLVVIRGKHGPWEDALRARWTRTMPDVLERIRWLPPQPRDDFLNLMTVADVLLDTFPFSGGNTSYEGLALGVPIVTLAAPFMRGRLTYGMYRKMNVLDCVADTPAAYIDRAVALATDPAHRGQVRSKILSAARALFEDIEAVQELEAFLKRGQSCLFNAD